MVDAGSTLQSRYNAPRLLVSVVDGLLLTLDSHLLLVTNRKARALVAYLAVEAGVPRSRERLAGLLWSEVGERQARISLRQALFELRGAFGPAGAGLLQIDHDMVALDQAAVAVDWQLTAALLEAGTVPDAPIGPDIAERILAGYEDISPAFADWLAGLRRRAANRIRLALEAGFDGDGRPGPVRRRFAEACLVFDPTHEAACRAVMLMAAEAGEPGVALRAYAELYTALETELDTEPSAATQALIADIKRGLLDPAPPLSQDDQGLPHRSVPVFGSVPVVAVLPFRTTGLIPLPPTLAEGLVEDIVHLLAGLREPVVISSNSTRSFTVPTMPLDQLGRLLGAQYFVMGSVRCDNTAVDVTVELVPAADSRVLWTKRYMQSRSDIAEALRDIAINIAHTLAPHVKEAELRLTTNQAPADLGAYHLLLHARDQMFKLEHTSFLSARDLLAQAAQKDPRYPPIHSTVADWYSLLLFQGWSENHATDVTRMMASAREALRLDPGDARMLAFMGHNLTMTTRRYDDALHLFDRALALGPNIAEAWMWSSGTFSYMGDVQEGIRRAERGVALSPEDPFLFRYESFCCIAHYAARNFDAAAHWGYRAFMRNGLYTSTIRFLSASLVELGRREEARSIASTLLDQAPDFRVGPMVQSSPFRDEHRRHEFGRRLIEAGLPA
jgi:DNA-binding SARP family transcriptional activator/TolB-like protein/Tfp pilus assembly protein PilF